MKSMVQKPTCWLVGQVAVIVDLFDAVKPVQDTVDYLLRWFSHLVANGVLTLHYRERLIS